MKIAVTAERADINAFVPECYEESPFLLIFETDTWNLDEAVSGPGVDLYYKALIKNDCEALVCGHNITKESFEPIALAAITRYCGEGFSAILAVQRALDNQLRFIVDYEGGNGCHPDNNTCDGDCGNCSSDCSSCC